MPTLPKNTCVSRSTTGLRIEKNLSPDDIADKMCLLNVQLSFVLQVNESLR